MPHAQDETFVSLTPTMVDSDHKRRVSAASTANASTTNRDSESFQRSSSDSKRILDEEDEDRDRVSPSPIDNIRPVPTREQTVDPRWLPTYIPPDHPRRTLVVCLDGTGDQFDADNSNIVRFFSMLKKDDKEKGPSEEEIYKLWEELIHKYAPPLRTLFLCLTTPFTELTIQNTTQTIDMNIDMYLYRSIRPNVSMETRAWDVRQLDSVSSPDTGGTRGLDRLVCKRKEST